MVPYTPPEFGSDAFNCPHCGAYAKQTWGSAFLRQANNTVLHLAEKFAGARCERCVNFSLWVDGKMAYPRLITVAGPNPDMPVDIQGDYKEAAAILDESPRGSAALLRLSIQKLSKALGQPGENINADIGELVKAGLAPKIQKALDVVRVVGNNAVHPGQIDLKDDRDTALKLFALVNLIVEVMITQPKHVETLYESLPETAKDAIEKRDSR